MLRRFLIFGLVVAFLAGCTPVSLTGATGVYTPYVDAQISAGKGPAEITVFGTDGRGRPMTCGEYLARTYGTDIQQRYPYADLCTRTGHLPDWGGRGPSEVASPATTSPTSVVVTTPTVPSVTPSQEVIYRDREVVVREREVVYVTPAPTAVPTTAPTAIPMAGVSPTPTPTPTATPTPEMTVSIPPGVSVVLSESGNAQIVTLGGLAEPDWDFKGKEHDWLRMLEAWKLPRNVDGSYGNDATGRYAIAAAGDDIGWGWRPATSFATVVVDGLRMGFTLPVPTGRFTVEIYRNGAVWAKSSSCGACDDGAWLNVIRVASQMTPVDRARVMDGDGISFRIR